MALADTIVALEDGAIVETGIPATLLQGDGYISRLGITALPDGDGDFEEHNEEDVGNSSRPLHLAAASKSTGTSNDIDEADKGLPDSRRKNGDFAVYRYYIANAGYTAVILYTVFIILWMFCTEFSSR